MEGAALEGAVESGREASTKPALEGREEAAREATMRSAPERREKREQSAQEGRGELKTAADE